jgi:non-ribosomal peptide synthetase component F
VLSEQLPYWEHVLEGAPARLDLRPDHARGKSVDRHGGQVERLVSSALLENLRARCRQEGATLYMVVLTALDAVLANRTGQTDLVVGAPVAGRPRDALEPLIGFFANTVAVRVDCANNPTFAELLSRVKKATLGAYAHQDVPFEKVVETVRPKRIPGVNPIFQALCVLQSAPMPTFDVPGLSLKFEEPDSGLSRFDLSVHVWQTAQGLRVLTRYASAMFERETAEKIADGLMRALEILVKAPATRLSDAKLF